jgi:tRNA (guanine26-N2/guanine27-N2)-dimethyltransferase
MTKKLVFEKIKEGSTDVSVFKAKKDSKGPGSKEGVPFYNPSMELNRDLSIVFCQWFVDNCKKPPVLLDGLAASGIRGIRFANEIDGDFQVVVNDWDSDCYSLIKKNIVKFKNIETSNCNLNSLLSEKKFDYIDIDPFGSPVFFIDSAIRSIKNNGVIACTATDTATLCGVYPKVCFRRYGAIPFHSIVMKEIGLRILIGFVAKTAGVYDKGIDPLISYATDHYFRVYIRVRNGVSNANESMSNLRIIKNGEHIGYEKTDKDIGPLWMGRLQNKKIFGDLRTILFEKKLGTRNKLWKISDTLEEEADAPAFFYTTDSLASFLKCSPPKIDTFFEKLKSKGYDVYRTHFISNSFKTGASINMIEKVFKP